MLQLFVIFQSLQFADMSTARGESEKFMILKEMSTELAFL